MDRIIGTSIGGWNGATDTTSATGNAQPETSGLSLFAIGQTIEVAYLRIERTMPDGARREALRAEAQAAIPD